MKVINWYLFLIKHFLAILIYRHLIDIQQFTISSGKFIKFVMLIINTRNGPQSGPSIYNGTKGRKAAYQLVMRPKAAKWLIIVQRGLYPVFGKHLVFGKHPEFGKFTLYITPPFGYMLQKLFSKVEKSSRCRQVTCISKNH